MYILRMANDILKSYVEARQKLIDEKARVTSRLKEVTAALTGQSPAPAAAPAPRAAAAARPAVRRKGKRRIDNPMPLREAIVRVTAVKPLTKPEILEAVKKLGYRFGGKDPANSIQVILYGQKFPRQDGKFSPPKALLAKLAPSLAATATGKSSVPSTGKKAHKKVSRRRA